MPWRPSAPMRSLAAVVVSGVMAIDGWEYYQYQYAGKATDTGRQIATNHADFVLHAGSSSIHRTMEQVNPPQVFVYIPFGTSGKELQADVRRSSRAGSARRPVRPASVPAAC